MFNFFDIFQSGMRAFHRTEIALAQVSSNLLKEDFFFSQIHSDLNYVVTQLITVSSSFSSKS